MNRLQFLSLWLTVAITSTGARAGVLESADTRAAATEARMTAAERLVLTQGVMPLPFGKPIEVPSEAIPGAGYVSGIPRLSIPSLRETDASLGIAWVFGLRKDGATALPSGLALAATWDPATAHAGGSMIAGEARAKGFNVLLAGGANLARDPRNGRNFEYLGEDPWLAGTLDAASVQGIQSQGVLSTIKHFALNDQETARHFGNVVIDEAAARESDLLAFEIAIEKGQPGSIMCAYNRVNGPYACDNDHLLNEVLKRDWGYKGFVMSDWGAVPSLETALHGLDQQSGAQLDDQVWFGAPLGEAAARDPHYAARLTDMNRRVLRSIYAVGLDRWSTESKPIDAEAHLAVAEQEAKQSIVLLRNEREALPLNTAVRKIAVIGGYADSGVLSGGGSSQVQGVEGPAVTVPLGGRGTFAAFANIAWHRSSPLEALRSQAPGAEFIVRDGRYITDAVAAARQSDVAIIFATQWMTEGLDAPDLSLPQGQDALIEAVAAANPRTIVVLETGGPVLMPWLAKTAAVLEAWYPGARGGEAIAAVLFGKTNPSGHLPITFPASLAQLPHPVLPGSDTIDPDYQGDGKPGQTLTIDYRHEGADVGYRWYARNQLQPLFPFGYGLSYTTFEEKELTLQVGKLLTASFSVRNTGAREGDTVAQLYLINAAGEKMLRLVGYQRVSLSAGTMKHVSIEIDRRLLAHWKDGHWHVAPGNYEFALGHSATELGARAAVVLRTSD